MKNKIILIAAVILLLLFVLPAKVDDDAAKLANTFYSNLKIHDFSGNFQYFSNDYFERTSKHDAMKYFNKMYNDFGDVTNYELISQRSNRLRNTVNLGKVAVLKFDVAHRNGKTEETFVLFKKYNETFYRIDEFISLPK